MQQPKAVNKKIKNSKKNVWPHENKISIFYIFATKPLNLFSSHPKAKMSKNIIFHRSTYDHSQNI